MPSTSPFRSQDSSHRAAAYKQANTSPNGSCGMPSNRTRNVKPERLADIASGLTFTVECLADDVLEPTVIADPEGAHRFLRAFRSFRENPMSVRDGLALLHRAVRERRTIEDELGVGRFKVPVECRPVLGPTGAVHAVRMKVGGTSDESDDTPPLVPLEFDAARLAHFGRPDGSMPDLFPVDTTTTLPALLERVVWLDKRLELIALFDPISPAERWCESLVFADPTTDTRRHLWMAARSTTNDHGLPIVRAVIADITATTPPPSPDPMLEHLSTHTARGHGSALMDLRTTLMHSFSCHDDPRMALWRNRNPLLHPEDMPAVVKLLNDLADNRPTRIDLRLRFADDDPWSTLHATCTPLPNYSRPQASIDFWIGDHAEK